MTWIAKMRDSVFSRSHVRDYLLVTVLVFSNPSPRYLVIGGIVFLLGLGMRLWAKGTLRRNKMLTVTGPYALCRHPFYLGNLILDFGICLLAGRPLFLPFYLALFLLAYHRSILREEAFLEQEFPDDYRILKARPRLFPAIPRPTSALLGEWSAGTLLKEREVSRTFRLLAIPFLIYWTGEIRAGGWWEVTERDGVMLLLSAASLHLLGRIIYQVWEHSKSKHRRLLRWVTAALAASLILLCAIPGMAQAQRSHSLRIASEAGAVWIQSAEQLSHAHEQAGPNSYLVSDDVFKVNPSENARRFQIVQTFWSNFEVYHLLKAIHQGPAADAASSGK